MKIFVVMGTTGEYSDRKEWIVIAYRNEVLAKQHVELATKRAKEIEVLQDNYDYFDKDAGEIDKTSIWDKDIYVAYTGTRYWYSEIELATKLPKG